MAEEHLRFEVTESDKSGRLDKYLAENLSGRFSRAFIQKLIAQGGVRLNGEPVKRRHKISPGELIEITVPEPSQSAIGAEDIPLDIVYEDEHLLVVNKRQEMVVHPAPGNYAGTLVNALLSHCGNLSGIGGVLKPGIVHRLDKGTSGLLVAAKTDQAHKALAKQFKSKTVKKLYIAVVKGVVQLDNGIIEFPIGRSSRDRKKMAVNFVNSRDAVTQYRVLERFKTATKLEVLLSTGRTHQIRVHMSYIGHPILGDVKYGTRADIGRTALHSTTLGFTHPLTKKYMEFTSELPDDIKKLLEELKRRENGKKL